MVDLPRPKGSWAHSIAVVALVLLGIYATKSTVDRSSHEDGPLYLIASVIAVGFLAVVSKMRT